MNKKFLYSLFAATFPVFLFGLYLAGKLPLMCAQASSGASVIAFAAYALDKRAAQNDGWRISERVLLFWGLIGGWPGALLAQELLRHKSWKQPFRRLFWATVFINCAVICWFLTPDGGRILLNILSRL